MEQAYTTSGSKDYYVHSGNALRILNYKKEMIEVIHVRRYPNKEPKAHTYFNINASSYWGICFFRNGTLCSDPERKLAAAYWRSAYDRTIEYCLDEDGNEVEFVPAQWIRDYPFFID